MEDLIDLLKEMGATDVEYVEENRCNDVLTFKFKGRVTRLRGVHYNDSTGGIDAEVVQEI